MQTRHQPPLIMGLTGGIGSGKSTVAHMFQALGATVIDADAIAKQLTQSGGAAIAPIGQQLGEQFITAKGDLDREYTRQAIFKSPALRQQLESITHPLITAQMMLDIAKANTPVIVLDIPLLTETSHWRQTVNTIVVVDCLESTQARRVQARNGWSIETIHHIMRSQASRAQRLAIANHVIDNESLTLGELQSTVSQLWAKFGL